MERVRSAALSGRLSLLAVHTAVYRANALLTYAGSALAILAVLATLTGSSAGVTSFALTSPRSRLAAPGVARPERAGCQGGAPVLAGEHEGSARRRGAAWLSSRIMSIFLLSLQAYLAFSLQADLSSSFSWNTKLLFVYLVAEYRTPHNTLNQARPTCCSFRRLSTVSAGVAVGPYHRGEGGCDICAPVCAKQVSAPGPGTLFVSVSYSL